MLSPELIFREELVNEETNNFTMEFNADSNISSTLLHLHLATRACQYQCYGLPRDDSF